MIAGAALADFRILTGTSGGGGGGGSNRQQQDTRAGARAPTALVIGLGGGALPMALRRMYSRVKVATVELDPEMAGVAKDHFGLRESPDGLKVCSCEAHLGTVPGVPAAMGQFVLPLFGENPCGIGWGCEGD